MRPWPGSRTTRSAARSSPNRNAPEPETDCPASVLWNVPRVVCWADIARLIRPRSTSPRSATGEATAAAADGDPSAPVDEPPEEPQPARLTVSNAVTDSAARRCMQLPGTWARSAEEARPDGPRRHGRRGGSGLGRLLQQTAGLVGVELDAGAHRGGHGGLADVAALGGRRLEPQDLVESGRVVLDQLRLVER